MTSAIQNIHGHHIYTPGLGPEAVVIDIGACEGEFGQTLSERWGTRVFAIEANPENYARTWTGPTVTKHHVAIGERSGTVRLYLGDNPQGNSLDPRHRDVSVGRHTEVPGMTLRDFMSANGIGRLDLLKVDIEGAEIALFRSIDDETLRSFAQVSVEFHDFIETLGIGAEVQAVKARMRRLGFLPFVYRRPNIDVLFLNRRLLRLGPADVWRHRTAAALRRAAYPLGVALRHAVVRLLGRRSARGA